MSQPSSAVVPVPAETDLVARYVRAVGRYLPRRRRADVEDELAALLAEQVEERVAAGGPASAEEAARAVLAAMGPPAEVARRYRPDAPSLVGPDLYPAFRATAAVVLGVYALLVLLWVTGSTFEAWLIPFHLRFDAATHWAEVVVNGLANVGIVALLFALLERLRPQHAAAWDPASLPALPRDTTIAAPVSRRGEAVSLAGTALTALVFNLRPEWLGWLLIRGDEWGPFPLLAPGFRIHLPWLNAWWAAAFLLHAALLVEGRYRLWSRAGEALLSTFAAVVLLRIVTGPPFSILDVVFRPILVVVLVLTLAGAVRRAVRLASAAARRRPLAGAGHA